MGLNLLTVGKLVFPDYNSKNVCTTQEILDSYSSVMSKAKKDNIRLEVGEEFECDYSITFKE